MPIILVRFAELGLKSEKVRSRFLRQLADDIEENLVKGGVEHLMEVQRGRIFIDTEDVKLASRILKHIPGVFSFSIVSSASSDISGLMQALSDYGRPRIQKAMTYGLKVRRSGDHPYSSQDIAIQGGGAVVSHLQENDATVDLRHPDVWIEVEIRDSVAYIFDNRTKCMGGMPASSQGKVLLYLPSLPGEGSERSEMVDRAILSHTLMRRRGCKVIPVMEGDDVESWSGVEGAEQICPSRSPFELRGNDLREGLMDATLKLKVSGVVFPSGPGDEKNYRVLHSEGAPISQFFPTSSMDHDEVKEWLNRLLRT